ncbi:MAG: hypothetical protein QOH06_5334 [Acidobacteriota bacterium]|jgi:hypothetical protein|nr:hypothetical protein [Acidobacteriota bacterium]
MKEDPCHGRTLGECIVRRGAVPFVAWIVGCFLVLSGGIAAGADDPDPCDLDGTAKGPCSIPITLDNQVVTQALPFDVPVFLTGKAKQDIERLVLHVFSAREPLRVERACDPPGTSFEKCPPQNRKLVCNLEASDGGGLAQAKWNFSDLDGGGKALLVDCELEPRVSIWNRSAGTGELPFALRVPPEPANRYFIFLLEVGKKPTPAEQSQVESAFKEEIAKALAIQRNVAGSNFRAWTEDLRGRLCAALEKVGWEQGIRYEMESGSMLSCPPGGTTGAPVENQRLMNTLDPPRLLQLLNPISDIVDQARTLENLRSSLRARQNQLPILAGTEPLFDLTDEALDARDLDVAPLLVNLGRVGALENELTQAATATQGWSQGELDSLRDARLAVSNLRSSANQYKSNVDNIIGPPAATLSNETIVLQGSNIGSFLTRQKSYLAADFGVLYATDAEQALPYIGTNIYLMPVNKQAPLAPWWALHRDPLKRFGFTLGLTVGEFDADRAEPLFSSMNGVLGLGYRVTESIRVGGGAVIFREADRDPLSKAKSVVYSPYASVSFDYDVQGLIKWFNNLFGGK